MNELLLLIFILFFLLWCLVFFFALSLALHNLSSRIQDLANHLSKGGRQ